MNTQLRILVSDLACSRGERQLFAGLSFSLDGGTALVITGPNGTGKTTLLRTLAGFVAADAGTVVLQGAGAETTLAQSAHFIGHRDGLRAALTVRENLDFAPVLLGQSGLGTVDAAAALNLTRLLDLPVGVLSAGQRRRTALARMLTCERPVWLLDEPTSALDAASQDSVGTLLSGHVAKGGIVVAATHMPLAMPAMQELTFTTDGSCSLRTMAQ